MSPANACRTNNLLVCTVFACANIHKVEKGLATRESANEVLEHADFQDGAVADQDIAQTPHVGVDATHYASAEGNIFASGVHVVGNFGEELRRSATAAELALFDVLTVELARGQYEE